MNADMLLETRNAHLFLFFFLISTLQLILSIKLMLTPTLFVVECYNHSVGPTLLVDIENMTAGY